MTDTSMRLYSSYARTPARTQAYANIGRNHHNFNTLLSKAYAELSSDVNHLLKDDMPQYQREKKLKSFFCVQASCGRCVLAETCVITRTRNTQIHRLHSYGNVYSIWFELHSNS